MRRNGKKKEKGMSKIELKEVERKEKGRIKQTVNKESRKKSHFVCFDKL